MKLRLCYLASLPFSCQSDLSCVAKSDNVLLSNSPYMFTENLQFRFVNLVTL